MENVLTLCKFISLWFCFLLHSVDISNLLSYIQNMSSNELARPVMGTIFLVSIIMVRAISVYSAGVPYAARFTAAVKIIESYLKAISSDYGSNKEY